MLTGLGETQPKQSWALPSPLLTQHSSKAPLLQLQPCEAHPSPGQLLGRCLFLEALGCTFSLPRPAGTHQRHAWSVSAIYRVPQRCPPAQHPTLEQSKALCSTAVPCGAMLRPAVLLWWGGGCRDASRSTEITMLPWRGWGQPCRDELDKG